MASPERHTVDTGTLAIFDTERLMHLLRSTIRYAYRIMTRTPDRLAPAKHRPLCLPLAYEFAHAAFTTTLAASSASNAISFSRITVSP